MATEMQGASTEQQGCTPGLQSSQKSKARLVSLDVLRGLTMAVMLIVDQVGDAYPAIGHATWDGIHLADFVMPFFLVISGVSMSISVRAKPGDNIKKVFIGTLLRCVRLILVGLFVQGPVLGTDKEEPYLLFDLSKFRIMGILQRIAIAYAIVAAIELFVPTLGSSPRHIESLLDGGQRHERLHLGIGLWIFRQSALKWLVAIVFWILQIALTYGVRPPLSWPGCSQPTNLYKCDHFDGPCRDRQIDQHQLSQMGCSSVGWMDSMILGIHHVYVRGSDVGEHGPANFGFDPEGFITSWGAVFTMYFGLHLGHVWRELRNPGLAMSHWLLLAVVGVGIGSVLSTAVPLNKRLWSPSYNLLTSGACAAMYALLFLACDAAPLLHSASHRWLLTSRWCRAVLAPLQWLGTNSILFFVMSDCSGLLSWLLRMIAWGSPHSKNNIVYFFEYTVLYKWFRLGADCSSNSPCGPVILVYTLVELVFWILVCGVLHKKGIFWKL